MSKKPNLVFILADDLGVRDLGCYGSDFHETPNLDRLASEGVRFTNAYASHPVCGPSRSAIMSGRSPIALQLDGVNGSLVNAGVVWPKVLQDAGYKNHFFGKWHMGERETVLANGFHYNIGGHAEGQPASYYYPYRGIPGSQTVPMKQSVPDMDDGQPGDYLTDKLTDKVLNFIETHQDEPFLLYLSYYQTHKPACAPAQGKKEWVDYYKQKLASMQEPESPTTRKVAHGSAQGIESLVQRNPEFAGQLASLDENIGRVMNKLEQLNLTNDTIVIFTADQGSVCISKEGMEEYLVSSQAPYRLGKAWLFEGGLRVPLIVRWPGKQAKDSINDTVTFNTDLYPTILEMLGLPLNPEQHTEGVSITKAIRGERMRLDRSFIWKYNRRHDAYGYLPSAAIRRGDYKLIYWMQDEHMELYNVAQDIGEEHDLRAEDPQLTQELLQELLHTLQK